MYKSWDLTIKSNIMGIDNIIFRLSILHHADHVYITHLYDSYFKVLRPNHGVDYFNRFFKKVDVASDGSILLCIKQDNIKQSVYVAIKGNVYKHLGFENIFKSGFLWADLISYPDKKQTTIASKVTEEERCKILNEKTYFSEHIALLNDTGLRFVMSSDFDSTDKVGDLIVYYDNLYYKDKEHPDEGYSSFLSNIYWGLDEINSRIDGSMSIVVSSEFVRPYTKEDLDIHILLKADKGAVILNCIEENYVNGGFMVATVVSDLIRLLKKHCDIVLSPDDLSLLSFYIANLNKLLTYQAGRKENGNYYVIDSCFGRYGKIYIGGEVELLKRLIDSLLQKYEERLFFRISFDESGNHVKSFDFILS